MSIEHQKKSWQLLEDKAKTDLQSVISNMTASKNIEAFAKKLNEAYRDGDPLVSDWFYDHVIMEALRRRDPNHPLLNTVEPEPDAIEGKTVKLPARMLSTNKAYSHDEIKKWAESVMAEARKYSYNENDPIFRVTPKLDGYASYFDNGNLYTRGDGYSGTDITRALDRGVGTSVSIIKMNNGPGELVVSKSYFQKHLADKYENSRNIIAAVIKEGELDEEIKGAILCDAIRFYNFSHINGFLETQTSLMEKLEDHWDFFDGDNFDWDTDGLVIETTVAEVKAAMGHTNHHHRWQIAYKKNIEFHDIEVIENVWQTSKNGRLTPVVQLVPTKVSGVTISRATGHHYSNVTSQRIDTGAIVRVCRSGLVIPYIESVVRRARNISYPCFCPSCGAATEIDGDNLLCGNDSIACPAQVEGMIEFFFQTLGNVDGFGPSVIEKLNQAGYNSVSKIYNMTMSDFEKIFFGKTAINLCAEKEASISAAVEDWRFLAAFSIHNVGKGGCERLLKHHALLDVFKLTADDIMKIDGFAHRKANSLVRSLSNIKEEFDKLYAFGFNLVETPRGDSITSPIAGKTVVFTGSMMQGKRDDMERQAKQLGAKVSGSVSSKTDYLICGANVGAAKTESAKKNGTTILSEDEYLRLIEN